ncbi:MAG TPA: O-antigen ligase family protein, partial [Thermoanaerobaculia bacterium]|nr:O-antigen ligase family protein [Thermoanaerobaculia bacterium]
MKAAQKVLPHYHSRRPRRFAEDTAAESTLRIFDRRISSLVAILVATTLVLVPLLVSPGAKEAFRTPKQLLFESASFLALILIALGLSAEGIRGPLAEVPRRIRLATAALLSWMIIATAASTNLSLSLYTLMQWFLAIAWMAASVITAARIPVRRVALIVLVPAVVNALLAIVFALSRWNPVRLPEDLDVRSSTIALLGNPNDLAAFLIPSAMFAVAFAVTHSGFRRMFAAVAAALIGTGIVVAQSQSGFAACAAGLLMLALSLGRKSVKAVGLAILASTAVLLMARPALFTRFHQAVEFLRSGNLEDFFSGRLLAYWTAFQMWLDHPVTGVGPGTFRWHYLPYKIEAQQAGIFRASAPWSTGMFAEVHSDFLQVLAETGLPGLVICLVALGSFAALGRRRPPSEESTFSRKRRVARILP